MPKSTEEIVEKLMDLTHRVRRGGRASDARGKGLGGANGFVLRHIREHDGASPSELRDALNVTTPRVTAILNDLEGHGLIVREAADDDRRRVSISLTDEGRAIVDAQLSQQRAELEELVERIGPDDAAALVRILETIISGGSKLPF